MTNDVNVSNDPGSAVSMLENALLLAKSGFAVFPLQSKGKRPITQHGLKGATTDSDMIRCWWSASPNANIGIATGAASGGLLVIDIDIDEPKNKNGMEALNEWEKTHGALACTLATRTGRGGIHLHYRTSTAYRNTSNQALSIDIRGEGGYDVAPPSSHENGSTYSWLGGFDPKSVAIADDLVLSFVDSIYPKNNRNVKRAPSEVVSEGGRNTALTSFAGSLQQMGASDADVVAYANEYNSKSLPPWRTTLDN